MDPGQTVGAVLGAPDEAHLWWLDVPAPSAVNLVLTNLAADYRLYVYAPDGSAPRISQREGPADESMQLLALPGLYQVFVDSPGGGTSPLAYRLESSVQPLAALPIGDPSSVVPPPGVTGAPILRGPTAIADNFEDPITGWLPRTSPQPTRYSVAYLDGEYQIRTLDPSWTDVAALYLPGDFSDVVIAVDVRVVEGNQELQLGCRAGGRSYRLIVNPEARSFRLFRYDGGAAFMDLAPPQPSAAIRGGAANHVELACVGNTIAASVNGELLISVEDSRFAALFGWARAGLAPWARSASTT